MENCNFDDFYLLSKCLITMNGHSRRWWETCSEHDIAGGDGSSGVKQQPLTDSLVGYFIYALFLPISRMKYMRFMSISARTRIVSVY